MDNDGNIFDDRSNRTPSSSNSNLPSWQNIWDLRFDWNNNSAVAACVCSSDHSLAGTGSASGSSFRPDRPPPSLKLGKRQYLERSSPPHPRDVHAAGGSVGKRPRDGAPPPPPSSSPVGVADCQVDDCHVALAGAKEYHRRHKVCEMHAKAPKVLVRGFEQRFCQQCSRFHAVSAFDDSKRSCRRRLAGHNERRRKSSLDPMLKTPTRRPDLLASAAAGRALSLLSSESDSLLSPADLSSRSSAALRELIAENRASIFSRQLFLHQSHHATEDLGRTRVSPQS